MGFSDIDESMITAFKIHRVTPEFIDSMSEIGFTDLEASQLVAFRVHKYYPFIYRLH